MERSRVNIDWEWSHAKVLLRADSIGSVRRCLRGMERMKVGLRGVLLALMVMSLGCESSDDPGQVILSESAAPDAVFTSEADFIVESIVLDLVEMVWFASLSGDADTECPTVDVKEDTLTDDGEPAFEIVVRTAAGRRVVVEHQLEMTHAIWDPALYEAFVRKLLVELPWAENPDFTEPLDGGGEHFVGRGA